MPVERERDVQHPSAAEVCTNMDMFIALSGVLLDNIGFVHSGFYESSSEFSVILFYILEIFL